MENEDYDQRIEQIAEVNITLEADKHIQILDENQNQWQTFADYVNSSLSEIASNEPVSPEELIKLRSQFVTFEEQFSLATEEDSKRDETLSERISSLNEKVETYAEKTSSSLEGLDGKYESIKGEIKKINLKKSENQNSDGQSGAKVNTFLLGAQIFTTEDQ